MGTGTDGTDDGYLGQVGRPKHATLRRELRLLKLAPRDQLPARFLHPETRQVILETTE